MLRLSSKSDDDGLMQAIISVFEFPPKESFRILEEKKPQVIYQIRTNKFVYPFNRTVPSGYNQTYLVIFESLYGM